MIELRWFTRNSDLDIGWGDRRVWAPERVLQYRQWLDHAVYAGQGPWPDSSRNMQWTEWQDVPEVKDPDIEP